MTIFEFVKSKVPILDVISSYSKLKRAGIYWKGNCPFHSEKTPSFTVSPHREIFYCFGCHEGGDIIAFIAKAENCNQLEAAKSLIEKYGLTVPESLKPTGNQETTESIDEKKQYFKIYEEVAEWAQQSLLENKTASSYVKKRKIEPSTIRKFCIGYFPPRSIKKLLTHMHKKGFVAKDLMTAGILTEGKSNIYSPFEDRILFPIKDHIGRFCGFGGRVFKKDDDRAKYYNSKENNNFTKGSILFGLDIAKEEIRKQGFTFLVEGYTDCIAMYQAGYPNTIATLGTSCTQEHMKILNRFASEVYILYDGDKAGQEAILRLTELCWDVSLDLKVVCLPSKEDPASFIASGESLAPFIENKRSIYSFFTGTIGQGFYLKNLDEKLKAVAKLLEMIQKVEDPIKQNILIQDAVASLNIPIESLTSKIKPTYKQQQAELRQPTETTSNKLENSIFSAVINNIALIKNIKDVIPYFSTGIKSILKKLIEMKTKNDSLEFSQFYSMLEVEEQAVVNKHTFETNYDLTDNFEQLLARFQKQNWKKIAAAFKDLIGKTNNKEEINSLLVRFQNLKEKMVTKG
jgi:DNA primase